MYIICLKHLKTVTAKHVRDMIGREHIERRSLSPAKVGSFERALRESKTKGFIEPQAKGSWQRYGRIGGRRVRVVWRGECRV